MPFSTFPKQNILFLKPILRQISSPQKNLQAKTSVSLEESNYYGKNNKQWIINNKQWILRPGLMHPRINLSDHDTLLALFSMPLFLLCARVHT